MSSPNAVPDDLSHKLDTLSFAKYMKNIGRAYRKQAMELISICRIFAQAGEQSVSQDAYLSSVLEVVDNALSSAADKKSKTSGPGGTNNKIEEAIKALGVYERKYHSKQQSFTNRQQDVTKGPLTVAERMKSAKENDKSSSSILNKLKECFKAKPELVEGPTKVVRFLLPRSLTDEKPDNVEQVLCEETRVEEILWNFSRLEGNRRITLKQNPHFYAGLPRLAYEYSDDFTTDPIEIFWGESEISVLTHERSRVFLETDDKKRAFGNFWVPDEAIIFKAIGGRLEGERIVEADIPRGTTPKLWHREGPRIPTVISPAVTRSKTGPAIPSDLPPIDTNPVRGKIFEDWRQLVRDTLNSPNISVCISTKGTPPESPNDWVLSSPTNPTPDPSAQPQALPIPQASPTPQESPTLQASPTLQTSPTLQASPTPQASPTLQASPTSQASPTLRASPTSQASPTLQASSTGATALPQRQLTLLQIPISSLGPPTSQSYDPARPSTCSPVSQTPPTLKLPPFASPPKRSTRQSSAAAPPSSAKSTPISQDTIKDLTRSRARRDVGYFPCPPHMCYICDKRRGLY